MIDAVISPMSRPVVSKSNWRLLSLLKNAAIGTLFCTNPVTAVIALGWVMRRMRYAMGLTAVRPGWLMGEGGSALSSFAGGLWSNLRHGVAAAFTLAMATLPFTALWALAWWAGWENSFNKGYEQAFVGPLLSFLAMAVASVVLCMVPMALAHQAAEGKWQAFFQWRKVLELIAHAGWRYPALIIATAVLALPLTFSRMAALLIEDIILGFATLPPGDIERHALVLELMTAAYAFLSLTLLRLWAARLHWRATARAGERTPRANRIFYALVALAASLALVLQIYVAQFFSHSWINWLSHPYFLLPWNG